MRKSPPNEHRSSIADVGRNDIVWEGRKPMPGPRGIDGISQVSFGIDQCAVEIENQQIARHQLSTGFRSDFFFFFFNCSSHALRMSYIASRNDSLIPLGASDAQISDASTA